MKPNTWTERELRGERWIMGRISLAPLELPAFSVTWSRVDTDRVHLKGAYRLRPELAAGVTLPEWLLLLGAMGLHVYGEGHDLIVQDRAGETAYHDAYRLMLVQRFVRWHVQRARSFGPLPRSTSELATLVRKHLEAGFWDLPAGEPMPGDPETGERLRALPTDATERAYPKTREFETYLQTGVRPKQLEAHWVPRQDLGRRSGSRSRLPRPRTFLSKALRTFLDFEQQLQLRDEPGPLAPLASRFGPAALPLWIAFVTASFPVQLLLRLVLLLEWVALPRDTSPEAFLAAAERHPLDDREPFVQLHEALTVEGLARLKRLDDPIGAEQWLVHMEEVFADYRALTAKDEAR
jgi:hypothetical protein